MKKKHKSKIQFTFFKKHKKIAVILVCLALFLSSLAFINYSRYVKDIVQSYYLRTKKFYFSSNRLTIDNKVYKSNPWVISDPNDYEISISLNTKLNSIKVMENDVDYEVSCSVTTESGTVISGVKCYIKGTAGELSSMSRKICGNHEITTSDRCNNEEPNLDNFNIVVKVTNSQYLNTGDHVFVNIEASSTSPYRQTLRARFELIVGDYGISYEIDDEMNRRYIDCIVTNTLPDEKPIVELTITDPTKILFDQNNSIVDIINNYSEEEKTIYGYGIKTENGYVKSIRFKVDEKTSALVRFYKKILSENYSYTINSFRDGETEGIVKLTVLNKTQLEEEYEASLIEPEPDPEPEPEPEPDPEEEPESEPEQDPESNGE